MLFAKIAILLALCDLRQVGMGKLGFSGNPNAQHVLIGVVGTKDLGKQLLKGQPHTLSKGIHQHQGYITPPFGIGVRGYNIKIWAKICTCILGAFFAQIEAHI